MEIVKGVYKISYVSNVYVVLGVTPTIIDCGDPSDRELIKKEIEKIIPLDEIKRVILTHLHYDHCGAIKLFENAKIYASKEEIDDFEKCPQLFFLNHFGSDSMEFLKERLEPLPNTLEDFEIIKVPGHTQGSIALLYDKEKLLFSGDTLFFNGIGRTDFPNSVPEEMEKSLKKLLDMIKTKNLKLCPGHDY